MRGEQSFSAESNGSIKEFGSGAVRSGDAEEYRFDLISPIGLAAVARAARDGADKYGDYNWEKGMPAHDLLNHALRHIFVWLAGDRQEDHLGHAAWGVMGAIHSMDVWPELNAGTLRTGYCEAPVEDTDGGRDQPDW